MNVVLGSASRVCIILLTFTFPFNYLVFAQQGLPPLRFSTDHFATEQLTATAEPVSAIHSMRITPFAVFADELPTAIITIEVHIADPRVTSATVGYSSLWFAGGDEAREVVMRDDGQEGDREAGDRTFTARFTTGQQITGELPLYDRTLGWQPFTLRLRDASNASVRLSGSNITYLGVVERNRAVTARRVASDILVTPYAANIILDHNLLSGTAAEDAYGYAAVNAYRRVYSPYLLGTALSAASIPDLFAVLTGGRTVGNGALYSCGANYGGRLVEIAQLNSNVRGDRLLATWGYRWGTLSRSDLDLTYPGTNRWNVSDVRGVLATPGKYLQPNPDGGGGYIVAPAPADETVNTYSDIELYLMGVIPANEVTPHRFVRDPVRSATLLIGDTIRADETMVVTADDIRRVYPDRIPQFVSNRVMRAVFLLATTEPASAAEMSYVDAMARHYGSQSAGAGLVEVGWWGTRGDMPGFAAATGNRAKLTTRLPVVQQPKRRRFTNRGGRL